MKSALVAWALLAAAAPAAADVGQPVDIATRARGAGRVVVARVIDVRAQLETNRFGDQLIVSHAVLEVLETLKGTAAATVTVAIEGGTLGDLTLKVSDLPGIAEGERGVFFLDAGRNGEHVPHRRGQGIVKLNASDRVDAVALSLDDIRREVRTVVTPGREVR